MALIDKLEAANRLIVSGAKMHQSREDPLAIHVVASSALNMLRELLKTQGSNYQVRILQEGLFLAATARAQGETVPLPDSPQLDALIAKILPGIENGELIGPDQIEFDLSKAQIEAMLKDVYRPYNFLKHADRDPLETLDESDVDPAGALQHAILAFSWIVPDQKWPEEIYPFFKEMDIAGSAPD